MRRECNSVDVKPSPDGHDLALAAEIDVLALLLAGAFGVASYGQAQKPCLSYAYPKGQSPGSDLQFDTAFDRLNVNGASFSCGPAIAASKARDALESFRYGVLYHDKAHLDAVLHYPLKVGIYKTRRIR